MKKLTLISLFVGLTFLMYCQTIEDKQMVIQMCIDLEDFQQYYKIDIEKDRKPLTILDNGIVSTNLKLVKFGEPVQFMTNTQLFFFNITSYLVFAKFNISSTYADIEFKYFIEKIIIKLEFEKINDLWKIKTKSLIKMQ